ncbi:MAG: DUF2071 domain-containing protein [Candidatus Acidiferrum sp.]|jgi:uncharacterized protein YqjF (DUF2071 family)
MADNVENGEQAKDGLKHRPWALPHGRWVMAQNWHDLLFAHWPVPVSVVRGLIPAGLEIDTFDGAAWLGVIPFRMSRVRLPGTPALPWLSFFPELNVRTYVVRDGKPGVWFFSLDAGNFVAVAIARRWFDLPYFRARMRCEERDEFIHYESMRTHGGAAAAAIRARYRPLGPAQTARPGTLEYFLTERYCLYTADRRGRLIRGEIHHAPWLLQMAEAEIAENSMASAAGMTLPDCKPLLYFSRRQDVVVWPPRIIT